MPFDYRRIKQREDKIFNITAKTMALYVRKTPASPPSPTGDLFAADTEPSEAAGTLIKYYFRGKYDEIIKEDYQAGGYIRSVKATITVPMIYKSLLATASYIDPYLDGSRFKKTGSSVSQGRLYIVQDIESVSLQSLKEVPI